MALRILGALAFARSPRNTTTGSTRSTARCRRPARHAVPQRLGPQRSRRPVVSPLVRRRRHDLGHPLRRSRHPLPQPLRRDRQYRDETRAGHIVNRGFGKMRPGGVLANALRQPANVSNTSVVMRDGRLLSLWEGGPPFALDPVTLETRGIEDVRRHGEGLLGPSQASIPQTGELFNFGIDYGASTTLTPYRLDKGGLTALPAVKLPYPVMNHDFVLTPGLPGVLHRADPGVAAEIPAGLQELRRRPALGRHAADPDPADAARRTRQAALHRDRRLLPVPLRQRLRGGRRAGPRSGALPRLPDGRPGAARYWQVGRGPAAAWPTLTRLRIDLATGKVERKTYDSGTANEFPCINPAYSGKRQRYAYIACNPADRAAGLQQQLAQGRSRERHGGAARFLARAVIPASRSSSPRGPAAPRMTAW